MKSSLKSYALILPMVLLYGIPLVLSLWDIGALSLGYFPALNMSKLTMKYYEALMADALFFDSLYFSIRLASVSTFLAVLSGFLIAYILSGLSENSFIIRTMKLPIFVPHFTAAFMVFLLLSQSGEVSRVMGSLRMLQKPESFPQLVFDKGGFGIIAAYLWKEIPFAVLVIHSSIRSIGDKYLGAAANLGTSRLQYVRHILFPLCMPSIAAVSIILFAFNFGSFEVPFLLGASYPKALPVLGYISYLSPNLSDRPYTAAISTIIAGIGFSLLGVYYKAFHSTVDIGKGKSN